jgi:hypothetical protein
VRWIVAGVSLNRRRYPTGEMTVPIGPHPLAEGPDR